MGQQVADILNEQEAILADKIKAAIYEFNLATGCFLNTIDIVYDASETIDSFNTRFSTTFDTVEHTNF